MCSQETIEKLNMRADHSSARAQACQPSKMLRAQAGPCILSAEFFLRAWLILCESEDVCKWKLFIQNKSSDSVVSLQTTSYTSWSDHHSVSLLCPLPACICSATWMKEPISMTTFSQCLNRLCDPALWKICSHWQPDALEPWTRGHVGASWVMLWALCLLFPYPDDWACLKTHCQVTWLISRVYSAWRIKHSWLHCVRNKMCVKICVLFYTLCNCAHWELALCVIKVKSIN